MKLARVRPVQSSDEHHLQLIRVYYRGPLMSSQPIEAFAEAEPSRNRPASSEGSLPFHGGWRCSSRHFKRSSIDARQDEDPLTDFVCREHLGMEALFADTALSLDYKSLDRSFAIMNSTTL